MLSISNVSKAFGSKQVLNQLSLEIGQGEICALIGPNGAGKSTLSFLIAGLNRADDGDIELMGHSLRKSASAYKKAISNNLGFATQDIGLYETLSGLQNLQFFAKVQGVPGARLRERVSKMVDIFDLGSFVGQRVGLMSGGQKRRLHAAIAFVHEPRFVILDEPTVGADIEARARLLEAIKNFSLDGTGILYTTHYLPEVESLGASIAILEAGAISYRDSLEATLSNFARSRSTIVCESLAPPIDGWQAASNVLSHYSNQAAQETAKAVNYLYDQGVGIRSITTNPPSLENAYLQITGHELEGGQA